MSKDLKNQTYHAGQLRLFQFQKHLFY